MNYKKNKQESITMYPYHMSTTTHKEPSIEPHNRSTNIKSLPNNQKNHPRMP